MTDIENKSPKFGGFGASRDAALINRTELAFLKRGIFSDKAADLRLADWTLEKLQQQSDEALKALGLEPHVIDNIRKDRPNIPDKIAMQILVAERFTCCVCREAELPVSIHHIHEWNESHDHSPENLCLVCPLHHVKAHTRSTMVRNLTTKTMMEFKAAWEAEVKTLDLKAVLTASRIQTDAWLYLNHLRLFEIAEGKNVRFKRLDYYDSAFAAGLIDASGMLRERDRTWSYMYDDGRGMTLYGYVRSVLHAVIGSLSGVNISDMLDVGLLKSILSPGDFVVLQGLFAYSTNDVGSGRGQTTHGRRSANHVEVEFTFDRWEATSNSAWGRWLRGSQTAAVLIRLVKISAEDGRLKLEGTAIAISQQLNGLKTREYASLPYRQGVYLVEDEDETDEFEL